MYIIQVVLLHIINTNNEIHGARLSIISTLCLPKLYIMKYRIKKVPDECIQM